MSVELLDPQGLAKFRRGRLSGTPTKMCETLKFALWDAGYPPEEQGGGFELPTSDVSEIHAYRFNDQSVVILKSEDRYEWLWAMGGTQYASTLEQAEAELYEFVLEESN